MSISLQRYPVFDVATPLKDLLFFEVVDYNLQANRNMSYGDAHHDVAKYPHHVLVYITPADKEGKFYRFYYAAKRENQDQYNWESAPTQIGGITVDSVSRTYIIPRSEFNASSPAIGSAMPDVPSGKFGTGWKLFNIVQGRTSEPELDSIYVVVKRIYVKDTQAIGKEYGKIVTEDIQINTLVPESTQPDTGIAILSSQVTPIGNGLATKETRKVSGGVWPDPVTRGLQRVRDNLIPQKFRNFVDRVTTNRKIASVPNTVALSGDEVAKNYTQETPDRVDEEIVTEVIDENVTPLLGKQVITTFGGGVADTSESLADSIGTVTGGFNVVSESVTPLGNGKYIKEKVSVQDAWPTLNGSKYDPDLDISIDFSDEVVPAGTSGGKGIDIDPIDKWRAKKRNQNVNQIISQLQNIHVILPTQQNIQLPNTLESVKVIVSRTLGNGNSISMGSSYSLGMDSTVSVSADLTWKVKEGYSGPVDAEIHVFYMPLNNVTAENIQQKVNAQPWPQYAPVSHRIVISGHGVTKSYDSRGSYDSFSLSESSNVTAFTNSAILPQCINNNIEISIDYKDLTAPTTGLDAAIDAKIIEHTARNQQALQEIGNGYYLGIPITNPQKNVLLSRIANNLNDLRFVGDLVLSDFPIEVEPQNISPTTPAEIVEGKYVYSANVQQYAYGMVRVTAVVVNITGSIL
jgi:hypothetical protein